MNSIQSTERLYYKDSIDRILRQNQILDFKKQEEDKLISNMKPKLNKKSEKIINEKRQKYMSKPSMAKNDSNQPLYKRYESIMLEKQEKLHRLKEQRELEIYMKDPDEL